MAHYQRWTIDQENALWHAVAFHQIPRRGKEAQWRKILNDANYAILHSRTWEALRSKYDKLFENNAAAVQPAATALKEPTAEEPAAEEPAAEVLAAEVPAAVVPAAEVPACGLHVKINKPIILIIITMVISFGGFNMSPPIFVIPKMFLNKLKR